MSNLKPLKDCIKLVADLIEGGIHSDFSNVLGDLVILLPEIRQMPSPSSLSPADFAALVETLSSELTIPGDVGAVVKTSLKLLEDLISFIIPDVLAIVSAAKQ